MEYKSVAQMAEQWGISDEIPPKDLSDITYHHFTGNQMIYRTGFIPQNI